MKAIGQQRQIDNRLTIYMIGPKDPRFARSSLFRNEDRDCSLHAVAVEGITIVALREPRSATSDVNALFGKGAVGVLEAIKRRVGVFLTHISRRSLCDWLLTLRNEIGNRFGITKAVRMMAASFLDHDGDPSAELLIDGLDRSGGAPKKRIDAAANVQYRHIGRRE